MGVRLPPFSIDAMSHRPGEFCFFLIGFSTAIKRMAKTMNSTEIKSWKCELCGKNYASKEVADKCCCCSGCGENSTKERRLTFGMCRGCYDLHLIKRYENADSVPLPAGTSFFLFSCVLDCYLEVDEIADRWNDYVYDAFGEEEAERLEDTTSEEMRKRLRLYVCRESKPRWDGVSEHWCDYLADDDCDAYPPGDYKKADDAMEKYFAECGPWCYVATSKKWNGEVEAKEDA